jgi:hypothetical protein
VLYSSNIFRVIKSGRKGLAVPVARMGDRRRFGERIREKTLQNGEKLRSFVSVVMKLRCP